MNIEKEVKGWIEALKTKEALANQIVLEHHGAMRALFLYETAYNMLSAEQKAKFDKIAQNTDWK